MTARAARRRSRCVHGVTRGYIADFINEVEAATGSRDLVERRQRRYPDLGNPSALVLSAVTALRRRRS